MMMVFRDPSQPPVPFFIYTAYIRHQMLEQLCSSGRRVQTLIDDVIANGTLVRCATVLRVAQDNMVDK